MKKELLTMALAATVIFSGANFVNAAETVTAPATTEQSTVNLNQPKTLILPEGKRPCIKKLTPDDMKAKMEKRVEEFNKTLGLTDEQIAKAKEVRAEGHSKMKPLMEKKKAKIDEIRAVKANSSLSVKAQDKKVEALRNDLHKIDQEMRQIRKDNEKAFEAILTAEQKAKYQQIKEEGRKHYKEHKRPQGPENFGARPPKAPKCNCPCPCKPEAKK